MIVHWDEVEPRLVEKGHLRARWTNLGRAAGSVSVGVQRISLDEGDISTPVHVHADEEEIFYVLGGSGLSWQDDRTHEIRAGDCLVHRVLQEEHTLRGGPGGLDVLAFGEREHGFSAHLPRAGVAWLFPSWVEVGTGDTPWEREIAAGPPGFPDPVERPSTVVSAAGVERLESGRDGAPYVVRDLGRAAGSERTGIKLYDLAPGKMGPPPHCHSAEEELFVVLEGSGRLVLIRAADTYGTLQRPGSREDHDVRRGHVVSRPPGTRVAHAFVAGPEGLSFLAYGAREPNDIAYYPRSNKTYFRGVGVMTRLERVDYWDGEDEDL
jgi:uncharacterized cupin superfamily protein